MKNKIDQSKLKQVKTPPIVTICDAAIALEKIRVQSQVALAHLAKRGHFDPDREQLLKLVRPAEEWVDGRLAELVHSHPAAPWFTQISGTGGEAIGKVIGEIESFGKYYDPGDPAIPAFVTREVEEYLSLDKENNPVVKQGIWVAAIERFPTPSAMRKFGGLTPDSKRVKGQKLAYNSTLKTMWFRLLTSMNYLLNNEYKKFYDSYKAYLMGRFEAEGKKVIPTPKGRFCPECKEKKEVPATTHYCPDCSEKLIGKKEEPGIIFIGHVHAMALRREAQLFNDHLWLVWRAALGLPIREPYPMEKQGHTTVIDPWDMVDKPAKAKSKPTKRSKPKRKE